LLIPPVLTMLTNVVAIFVHRKDLTVKQFISFLIYILLPMICMLLQMRIYGYYLIMIGSTFSALVMFIIIQTEQADKYRLSLEENARAQSRILVLQMRPHFIYNTMTSIYYLCQENPEKAQQVILDFTTYLRKNFTALEKEGTIMFSDELEHTRAYLAVESVRFENQISFEFDTPETNFRLPPLTLQPLVENAVKYGLDAEDEPLKIKISTRKTDAFYEVLVEDNGPGFTETESDNPGVALNNIKKRLAMTCRGRLNIESSNQSGTRVKILIPV
jgi:sensor histidine kinase YesM